MNKFLAHLILLILGTIIILTGFFAALTAFKFILWQLGFFTIHIIFKSILTGLAVGAGFLLLDCTIRFIYNKPPKK